MSIKHMTIQEYMRITTDVNSDPDSYPISRYFYLLARRIRSDLHNQIVPMGPSGREILTSDYKYAILMLREMYRVESDEVLAKEAHKIVNDRESVASSAWLLGLRFIMYAKAAEKDFNDPNFDTSPDILDSLEDSKTVPDAFEELFDAAADDDAPVLKPLSPEDLQKIKEAHERIRRVRAKRQATLSNFKFHKNRDGSFSLNDQFLESSPEDELLEILDDKARKEEIENAKAEMLADDMFANMEVPDDVPPPPNEEDYINGTINDNEENDDSDDSDSPFYPDP